MDAKWPGLDCQRWKGVLDLIRNQRDFASSATFSRS